MAFIINNMQATTANPKWDNKVAETQLKKYTPPPKEVVRKKRTVLVGTPALMAWLRAMAVRKYKITKIAFSASPNYYSQAWYTGPEGTGGPAQLPEHIYLKEEFYD